MRDGLLRSSGPLHTAAAIRYRAEPAALQCGHLHQLFAQVLALQHPDERARGGLEALFNRLLVFELALAEQGAKLPQAFSETWSVIGDQKCCDIGAIDYEHDQQ